MRTLSFLITTKAMPDYILNYTCLISSICYTSLVIKVIDFDLFFSEGAQVPII